MTKHILHIAQRFIILIMAIQVLNLSTNSIDFQPIRTSNLTEFNDLNTVTEYFAEVVLGHKNAFPESKVKRQRQSATQKNLGIKLYNPSSAVCINARPVSLPGFCIPADDNDTHSMSREINPPPPKA